MRTLRFFIGSRLAQKSFEASRAPRIDVGCSLGADSKILGGIELGSDVVVGANSIVCEDFPNDYVIAGVPAKII